MGPTYRQRLRLEGAVLAGAGALTSAILVAGVAASTDRAASTAGQLAVVLLLLLVGVPLAARRWLAGAEPVADGEQERLSGQPTALWVPPLVVLVLAAPFVLSGELGVGAAGWDAGLRVTLGCLLVGLAQAVLLERIVAADEQRSGRRYVRLPGSRALSGTKLGFILRKDV